MFGHIILIATFLHLSYFTYPCVICRACVLTSGPILSQQGTVSPAACPSSHGHQAQEQQPKWDHSVLEITLFYWSWGFRKHTGEGCTLQMAMGEIRSSQIWSDQIWCQSIQRISQMVSHGTSSPTVLRALQAKSMSFRAWTQATECRSAPMWTLAALYQKNQGKRDDNAARHEKTFVMGSLRSTWEYIHKYHDNIVDAKCYLKNALLSKC